MSANFRHRHPIRQFQFTHIHIELSSVSPPDIEQKIIRTIESKELLPEGFDT